MFNNELSLNHAPPLRATLPFFLTAPIFLIIAAITILLNDFNFLDRWLPSTIGVIHFFNLGFLVMVMMGALTQMLPVLAAITIPNVVLVSRVTYILITIGAFFFPLGMILMNRVMIQIGSLAAWCALLIFYAINIIALQKGIKSFTLTCFKLSCLSALINLAWAGRLAWGWTELGAFTDLRIPMIELHIAWAFFGIVFILIMGIAYKVVPMFYVTPDHPRKLSLFGSKVIFFLLLLWTLIFQTFIFEKLIWLQRLIPFIKIGISAVVIYFSIETIRCLNKRKRPISDTTFIYWQLSMTLFSVGAIFYGSSQLLFEFELLPVFATAIFGLAILSLITGMLYKIIPFLIWLHLTKNAINSPPTTRELLPDRLSRKQFYLHLAVILSLPLCLFFPHLNALFALLLGSSLISTLYILWRPVRIYRLLLLK